MLARAGHVDSLVRRSGAISFNWLANSRHTFIATLPRRTAAIRFFVVFEMATIAWAITGVVRTFIFHILAPLPLTPGMSGLTAHRTCLKHYVFLYVSYLSRSKLTHIRTILLSS